jgi:hypothetical protein
VAAAPILVYSALTGLNDLNRLSALAASAAFLLLFVATYWPIASRLDILPGRLSLGAVRRLRVSRV